MKQLLFAPLSLLLLSESLSAQALEGRMLDKTSNEGVAYVNIGIVGKNIGTVSDAQGQFQLDLDKRYDEDTLKVSIVGYEPRWFTVSDFGKRIRTDPNIALTEAVVTMKEIVVKDKRYRGRKLKERVLGNTKATTDNKTLFESNRLGYEMGVMVKVRRKPTFVQDFSITLVENEYDTFKFRINFYSVKNGLPHQNILNENIVVSSSQKEGPVSVDLRKYNIVVDDDVFVTMEWIEDLGDFGLSFATATTLSTQPTITRKTSQGKWKGGGKYLSNVGIGITLTVLQ